MNDLKDLKPLGCEPIPQGLPKPKLEDLTPVSGHEYKEPEIEISNGYKVDIIKEWIKNIAVSGYLPKTPLEMIAYGIIIALAIWAMS